ncbi:Na+/H+ antiporter NhaD/arsenite permease-like protein [Bradyrhizobium japonicum]
MAWIVGLAVLVFFYRRATRAGDRLAELKPTGMLRSPLFHAQTALLCVLVMLMLAPSYLPHEQWAVAAYLASLIIVLAAFLLVRRALKWRYPI